MKLFGYEKAVDLLKCRLRDSPFIHILWNSNQGIPCGIAARRLLEGNDAALNPADVKQEDEETRSYVTDDWDYLNLPAPIISQQWNKWLEEIVKIVFLCSPCGALHTFDSADGPVTVSCTCDRTPHANHTAGDCKYRVKKSYFPWVESSLYLPCVWPNTLDVEQPQLFNFQEFVGRQALRMPEWTPKHLYENHFGRLKLIREEMNELHEEREMVRTCLGCLLSVPTEKLECGHKFCLNCLKIMAIDQSTINERNCPFCEKKVKWENHQLPPTAGYRILALDGGGVRGIVELLVLMEIEKLLGIPCKDLFDAVYATSTGSVVVASLFFTNANFAKDVTAHVDELVKKVFNKQQGTLANLLPKFLVPLLVGYLYDPREYDHYLRQLHLDQSMLYWNDKIKVGITSCLWNSEFTPVLFTNYNREFCFNDDPNQSVIFTDYTVKDAVRASTAAGFFFPPYEKDEVFYTDGGMQNNCPAEIAMLEAKLLWPNHKCDILLSVGTGNYRSHHDSVRIPGLYNFLKAAIDLTVNADSIWRKVSENNSNGNMLRINPTLSEKVD